MSESARERVARPTAWIKVASQAVFLAIFFILFALASFPIPGHIPVEIFLRLDPLITFATSLAARTLLPGILLATVILCSALLAGRIFCGYMCPLGAMLDFANFVLFRKFRKKPIRVEWLSKVRFGLLAFILAAALCGAGLLLWLSPMSLLTRFSTNLAFPLVGRALVGLRLVNYRPVIFLDAVALTLFIIVFGSLLLQERFWCRNICPLGALLGLAGRFGLRPVIGESCQDCGNCIAACPMGAIEGQPKKIRVTQCHQCLACQRVCPSGSVTFSLPQPEILPATSIDPGASRRQFLWLCSAGLSGAALSRLPIRKPLQFGKGDRLLRPPGVFDEEAFLERCVRCGECMKVCTYNALQPVRFDQGLLGIGSPHFVMRIAGCDPACAACGEVCPSGAIPKLSLQKKNAAVIGLAKINREACLLWKDQLCDRCVQACNDSGYRAIEPVFEDGFMRVRVMESKCNGCGWCEHHCPIKMVGGKSTKPVAAIAVVPSGRRYVDVV